MQTGKMHGLKLCIFLTIVLRLREILESLPNYQRNFAYESQFFLSHKEKCQSFEETVEFDYRSGVYNTLNYIFGNMHKQIVFLKKNNEKIIAKHRSMNMNIATPLREEHLSQLFNDSSRKGFQFCPPDHIQYFVNFFSGMSTYNTTQIWLFLLNNVELLLMPHLKSIGFPVPKTYEICGFTTFQEHVGSTLQHYYNADFRIKVGIAKQLLEAAWKFTYGFENFHIYLTDLTANNVVYNEQEHRIYFVDLNTVTIVYASGTKTDSFHRQEFIACNNCFAFSDKEMCEHDLSDLNFFATCLFLRENLKQERNGGFLHPIPEDVLKTYPNLRILLDDCVDEANKWRAKTEEKHRFKAASELIDIFKQIEIK